MSLKYILGGAALFALPSFAHEPVTKFDHHVVSATKMQETSFSVAGSASTIDQEDLKRKQPDRLHDLFKDVPGIEAGSGPRRTAEQINIRGFGQQRTVIRVDGGRQNFDLAHNGKIFVDPEFLRQVDVLRGSHSSIHGSGALGGVVSMSTLEAYDFLDDYTHWGALGKASYGTNDCEKMGKAALFGRYENQADGIVSVVARKSNDIKPGRGDRVELSRDQIKSGFGKVNLYVNEDTTITGSWVYFKDDHPIFSTPNLATSDTLSRPSIALFTNSNIPVDRDTLQNMGTVSFHTAPCECKLVDLTARYYGSETKIDDSVRPQYSTRLVREDRTRLDTHGGDIYNISHIPFWCDQAQIDWLYGVEHYQDSQKGTRNGALRPQFPEARLRSTGFYTRFDVNLPYVVLSPGFRHDHYKTTLKSDKTKRNFTKGSPSMRVKLIPCEEVFVYGSYARAFRAPSLSELHGTGIHFFGARGRPNLFIANPNLGPELAKTYETGVGFSFNDLLMNCDHLRIKSSYFITHTDDFIERNVTAFTTTLANVSSARIKGAEFEMVYETPTVFAGAAFSLLSGHDRDNKRRLASVPPHKASTLLGSKLPLWDIELGWRAVMNRRHKQTLNVVTAQTLNQPTPGYTTHDVYLSWAPVCGWGKGLEFGLHVDNMTDKHYRKYLSAVSEQGRNIKVSLSSRI